MIFYFTLMGIFTIAIKMPLTSKYENCRYVNYYMTLNIMVKENPRRLDG